MIESAYFANLAERDAYQDLGVEGFEMLGTLDGKTCGVCGSMDGKETDALTKPGGEAIMKSGGTRMDSTSVSGTFQMSDIIIGRSVGAKAKNYEVLSPDGEYLNLVEGSRITNIEVIAGKDSFRDIDIADFLVARFGGAEDRWQKVKGIGLVDVDGDVFTAELHWFQEESVGKVMWKLKPQKGGNWYID